MEDLTDIKIPLHLFIGLDLETAIILSFLYCFEKPCAWICMDAWLPMSKQKISKKIKENSKFFIKEKIITKKFRILTAYSLSEEGKKVYKDNEYWFKKEV